jgi:Mannosyl-glycoprotein endo-beta-N-acetylglucosaminidase
MKSKVLIFVAILGCFSFKKDKINPIALNYVEQYYPIAIKESVRSGIPTSVILAQGLLESAAGTSFLATSGNAHFGIKCKSNWSGDTIWVNDDDVDTSGTIVPSCFRKYTSPDESYIDHTNFLINNIRYKSLFNIPRTDYTSWALGLQNMGYATSPTYGVDLISIIEKYELMRFDIPDQLKEESDIVISTNNTKLDMTDIKMPVAIQLPEDFTPAFKRNKKIENKTIKTDSEFLFEISPNQVNDNY